MREILPSQAGFQKLKAGEGSVDGKQAHGPTAVKRQYIPKADGTERPLGIPTVRDRIALMAAKLVIEPIFEADFRPCSFGFRPQKSATDALETLRVEAAKGGNFVLDADIKDFFGSINHERLMKLVATAYRTEKFSISCDSG